VEGHSHVTPQLRFPVSRQSSALGLLVSAAAHGGVALAALVAGNAATSPDPRAQESTSRVTLVVPEITSPPPSTAQVTAEATRGDEGTSTATRESDRGALRAGARNVSREDAPSDASDAANSVNVLGVDATLSRVYQVIDVDSSAVRDPASSAPIYPEHLQRRGIEGWVVARFVIDTLGAIEPNSVVIVSTTSSTFRQAVLEAIPTMRYRPAQRQGRAVRQEAEQLFRFRVVSAPATLATQVSNP
jgi:TonB family protein